jgi:hypothetical protein
VDPDRVDARTLAAVARHAGLLADDNGGRRSFSRSSSDKGTAARSARRRSTAAAEAVSAAAAQARDVRWAAALERYELQRLASLGGANGTAAAATATAATANGTEQQEQQQQRQRLRRRLGVGGHQAHKQQVRAAILAHAYEAAARARPPPLTGDSSGGAHSRVKADQVRATEEQVWVLVV